MPSQPDAPELLRRLCEAHGISGREEAVRAILLEAIRDRVDACRIDSMGNLIAFKKGTGASRLRVLAAAHMDEVGLVITGAEDSGTLRFAKVGGIDDRVLPARMVLIGARRVPGVIGIKPVHLLERGERDRVPEARQLSIDVGASSRAEAERLAPRGETAMFASEFLTSAGGTAGTGVVQAKALDDRVGCAILVGLLAERFEFDFVAAFTVQEEVGLRGARVAAWAEKPDAALVLECTGANEVPSKRDVSPSTRLGHGPALTVRDPSFVADPRLVEAFSRAGSESGIPYQVKQPTIGGTDAGSIHRVREGVPSLTIAVPARYIHSPVSMMDLSDFHHTAALAREGLTRLPGALGERGAGT
ncbi:MAG TPA: M20/M25/M40 family metallo-hydrolase [Spirochaetia bacterium]|nr:M20/M25/M40 family metallo-hydrolase [Spirochaetia bacterium]